MLDTLATDQDNKRWFFLRGFLEIISSFCRRIAFSQILITHLLTYSNSFISSQNLSLIYNGKGTGRKWGNHTKVAVQQNAVRLCFFFYFYLVVRHDSRNKLIKACSGPFGHGSIEKKNDLKAY